MRFLIIFYGAPKFVQTMQVHLSIYVFIDLFISLFIYFCLYFKMERRNFLNTKIISDATYDTAIAPVKYSSKRHYAT